MGPGRNSFFQQIAGATATATTAAASTASAATEEASPSATAEYGTNFTPSRCYTGNGARFIYAAATIANILCENLTAEQIDLLGNFLTVLTACVYAILAVENPEDPV